MPGQAVSWFCAALKNTVSSYPVVFILNCPFPSQRSDAGVPKRKHIFSSILSGLFSLADRKINQIGYNSYKNKGLTFG